MELSPGFRQHATNLLSTINKSWQNNLPFGLETHSFKRNSTSYQFRDNQGLSFKVHLYVYRWRQTVLERKEFFQNGGLWITALGNHPSLTCEHLESLCQLVLVPHTNLAFSVKSIYSLFRQPYRKSLGFGGYYKIWDRALYSLVFLSTEQALHL